MLGAVLALAPLGCGGNGSTDPGPEPGPPVEIPAIGAAELLEVGAWNVEWFGSPRRGPVNDTLQLSRVATAVASLEVDVWGIVEVVDGAQWERLLARLPEYQGVLADDPGVVGGAEGYGSEEQKPALLVRRSAGEILGSRLVLTDSSYLFAGRPPLEARVRITLDGATDELLVLVVHLKAGAGADDRARREAASAALKRYLDSEHPRSRVLVIGDFNDDVDVSISGGATTPFANFVADASQWSFLTAPLSEAGLSSTTGYPDMVDHQLASDEARELYVPGSAAVLLLDRWIPSYDATTSDHYPVVTTLDPTP